MCTSFCLLFPSYSRFLPVWHFQSAQYPLTEYPLTFGWLDTFSRGREFIINLHLISPLYLKHFLEETKKKKVTGANGKVQESHLVCWIPHHTWMCGRETPSGKSQKHRTPFFEELSCSVSSFFRFQRIFFSQVSDLTAHKEIGYLMWVNVPLCDGVSFNLPYSSFRLFHFFYPCVPLYVTI